jgi:hypothetical protein
MITLTLLFIAWVSHIVTGSFIFGGLNSLEKMALCALVGILELMFESMFVISLSEKFREFYEERRRKALKESAGIKPTL